MSDALSSFISGLATLDPNNLAAPANQAALQKFQSLDSGTQRQVLTDLTAKHGTSFDELNGLSEANKRIVMDNMKNGRGTFDGINRNAPAQTPSQPGPTPTNQTVYQASHSDFARQHGSEAARIRHGYVSPQRQAQLERVAQMQNEAKRTGKSFAEVADAFVAQGK